jgi:hypothetical protein
MESAIHDVHTALNRPGVTGTKSRRSAHCVDGDKDQTADAAEKWFEENDRDGVGLEREAGRHVELLGARHTDRDRKAKLRPHALADCPRNFGRRTEEMGAARNIGKGLVNGNPNQLGHRPFRVSLLWY